MSWSDSFTGNRAYGIQEAYHRVIVRVSLSDLRLFQKNRAFQSKFLTLGANYFLHYLFSIECDEFKSLDSAEFLELVRFFISNRFQDRVPPVKSEIEAPERSSSSSFPSEEVQKFMFSVLLPLQRSAERQAAAFLSELLGASFNGVRLTYAICEPLLEAATVLAPASGQGRAAEGARVFQLLRTSSHQQPVPAALAASVAEQRSSGRADDFNGLADLVRLLAAVQRAVQERVAAARAGAPVFWGICPPRPAAAAALGTRQSAADEHDGLDYFLQLLQRLAPAAHGQAANSDFQHRRPPGAGEPGWLVYNETDRSAEHTRHAASFYGTAPAALSLGLHLVLLRLAVPPAERGLLKVETAELVQSFGLNAAVELPHDPAAYFFTPFLPAPAHAPDQDHEAEVSTSERDEELVAVAEMAERYSLSPETFLGRCLQQLGLGLVLSCQFPAELFLRHFARLAHPFSHRKPYASATRLLAVQIAAEDVEAVADLSRGRELAVRNISRQQLYLAPPRPAQWRVQSST
jgi:hypothetical protein